MQAPNPQPDPDRPPPGTPAGDDVPGRIAWSLRTTYGWIHPRLDAAVDVDAVLDVLCAHGAVAAVAGSEEQAPTAGASREFVVLTTPDDEVACVGAGPDLEPGVPVAHLARAVAEATGHAVDLGDVVITVAADPDEPVDYGSPGHGAAEPEGTPVVDVLLARLATDDLPLLARHLGCAVEAADLPDESFTLVRPTEPTGQLHLHRFASDELPVVALSRLGDSRYVAVLSHPGHLPGAFLSREAPWLTHLTDGSVEHLEVSDRTVVLEALAWFADPHLAPDSDLQVLCTSGGFGSTLDPERVAAALQTPDDDGWSRRVVEALGLPVLLADVHEGRAPLPSPTRVEPGGLGAALGGMFRRPHGRHGRPSRYTED